ncbi:MAG: cellulase family glycosylhydrolase [Acidimicrobiales bacterium]
MTRRMLLGAIAIVVLIAAGVGSYLAISGGSSATGNSNTANSFGGVTVSGNQLMSNGQPIRLIGVVISSSQYYCFGKHPQAFPMPISEASVQAIVAWHVNAVRILVPESCWLGLYGEPASMSESTYRSQIESIVSLLTKAHLEVVLAFVTDTPPRPDTKKRSGAKNLPPKPQNLLMPDEAHAPTYWTSVATTFKDNPQVIFDIYGEPEGTYWACWENGCVDGGVQYAGMQQLINVIRSTGAKQPIMLGGIDFSNDLSGWLSHEPTDPDHQLIADAHVYPKSPCNNTKCWKDTLGRTAAKVPLITGEFGSNNCSTTYMTKYMKWADRHAVSYIAWGWLAGGCSTGGSLISDFSGTPNSLGLAFKNHVAELYTAGNGNVGSVTNLPKAGSGNGKKHKTTTT